MGQLPVPTGMKATVASELEISLTWTDNSNMELASATDLLMIGMYDAETGSGYSLTGNFKRSDANGVITLPDNWSGRTVELFVFMISTLTTGEINTKEMVSDTVYLGSLPLAG